MVTPNFGFHWKRRKVIGGVVFRPAEDNSLERKLSVLRNARRDGASNHPPQDADGLSATEMEINEVVSALHRQSDEDYIHGYESLRGTVSAARAHIREDRFSSLVADAERQSGEVVREALEYLPESWSAFKAAKDRVDHYREMKGLRHEPAHYDGRLWKVAVLAALTVGESFLNASIFANGSNIGWIGGARDGLVISATSVLFSAGCGFLMRWINDTRHDIKRVGMAARITWVSVCVPLHICVAHYRDALVAGGDHPAREAVTRMMAHPFMLEDFHSILLILLGLMAATAAAVEGYHLDCREPGLGQAMRAMVKARDAYADAKAYVFEALQDIAQDAREQIRQADADAKEALRNYETALRDAAEYLRLYAELSRGLQATCVRLIRRYRDANTAERSEKPPAYFADEIVPPFAMSPDCERDRAEIRRLMDELESAGHVPEMKAAHQDAEATIDAVEAHNRAEFQTGIDAIESPVAPSVISSNGSVTS